MQTDPKTPLKIAAYVRVSTDDQNAQRQRNAIERKYQDHEIEWFVDLGKSGSNLSRKHYQNMRERIIDFDVVTAAELDRLGRSFSELADFVQGLREQDVDLDLVNQPISTVGEDDWMGEMLLNLMIVFADAERKMIRSRVQEGVDRAIEEGKRVGKPPFGYDVENKFLVQVPHEYVRAQKFIQAVKEGRQKRDTADFFGIPHSSIQSILDRAQKNYDIDFDNGEWQVERAKVKAGKKELSPLGETVTSD